MATTPTTDHDAFFGAEPEGPETVVPPPTAPSTAPPPPAPPAPTEPPPEPQAAEEAAADETEGAAEPEPEAGTPPTQATEPPPPPKKPSWRQELRTAKAEAEDAKRRLAELEQQAAERDARLAEAQRAISGQQPTQPWKPEDLRQGKLPTDADLARLEAEDPLLHSQVMASVARYEAQLARAEAQQQQFSSMVRNQIDDFRRSTPDYDDAIRHLEARETARLQAAGIPATTTPHAPDPSGVCCISHGLQARTGLLMQAAIRMGKSIPQLAYDVAKAEGWTAPSAAPPPPTAPHTAPLTPQEKVRAAQEKSTAATGSVGNIPSVGVGHKGPITRDDILSMSEKDLDRLSDELGEDWYKTVVP